MTDHIRVEFKTIDGVTLRGDFFQAEGGNVPCIVMSQGISLLKEHYLHNHAREFVKAGFSALVYDHRGYGSSEGLPRHETNPYQQAEDYHDAISAAMELPGVDPKKIVMWGIGHSAGAATIAAPSEPRVAAIILTHPFRSGAFDAANFPAGTLEEAIRDRQKQTLSGTPETTYVKLWPDSLAHAQGKNGPIVFLAGEVPYNFISGAVPTSEAAGTPWENKISLQSFHYIAQAEPHLSLPKIDSSKLLYVTGKEDPINGDANLHKKNFDTAQPGGEFVVVEPSHLGTYYGDSFKNFMKVQIDYLSRKLM